ncbi:AAA family ATPase [Marinobacter sp. chi1]|uniref:AAA family ATPase n=1 Tax=Marinobacter suaedae TaxID=3057675 RepID=A0ABT8VXI0_9GAMM|nr:AAA family ATPase [Marinobacter sp. chi1]MDO3720709.1 AAA family ATPase [Marinobacter sp. chi1]
MDLYLHFLGDMKVMRGGKVLALPPSRKTRALLVYLAIQDRAFHRQSLCELLWEIPDDPRGSLRWSLSKIRNLVDSQHDTRILADRNQVRFTPAGAHIDVLELYRLVEGDLSDQPLDALEHAASSFQGNLLEGLELPNFHHFHAWCVSERDRINEARSTLLQEIVDRRSQADELARALPYARTLAVSSPYDESKRAQLIRLLVANGLGDEAEQQYRLGNRLLKEVGVESSPALVQALHGAPGAGRQRPEVPRSPEPEPVAEPMFPRPRTQLVGRDDEISQFSTAIRTSVDQSCAMVILMRGEPGIGKSTLLKEAARLTTETGFASLSAAAFEAETLRPFALWLDALRQNKGEGNAAFAPATSREQLLEQINTAVQAQLTQKPLALFFDDVQWSDESSAEALHYVARMNRDRPLMILLASREAELEDNRAMQRVLRGLRHDRLLYEQRLKPLADADVRRIIEQRAPGADSDELCQRCRGNPLLAVELARAELSGGAGGSLQELVLDRMSRIDVDEAEVIRWAALLAPRISIERLCQLSGQSALDAGTALETAERQSLIQTRAGGFEFVHNLIARSIYNALSPTRRAVMHRHIALLLEQESAIDLDYASDLAHHASLSGDTALAVRACISAGRLCARFFANEDARQLATRGLQMVESLSEVDRVCYSIELNDILLSATCVDDWEKASDQLVVLAEHALEYDAIDHARRGYQLASNLRWSHGQGIQAWESMEQAERATRSGTEREAVSGLAEAARCLALLERDLPQADAMLMEASALAERSRMRPPAIPASLGMLRFHEHRFDDARALLREGKALYRKEGMRHGEFQTLEYLAMLEYESGNYVAASACCEELLQLGEKLPEGSEAPFARCFAALCQIALGGSDVGLNEAIEQLRQADAKFRLAYVLTRSAFQSIERGDCASASARGQEALGYANLLDRPTERTLANAVLAYCLAQKGDMDASKSHRDAALSETPHAVAQWALERIEQLIPDECNAGCDTAGG